MDKKQLEDMYSWPDDYPVPAPRFGKGPTAPKPWPAAPLLGDAASRPPEIKVRFSMEWEDTDLGLKVVVEDRRDGEVVARATSGRSEYFRKAAVSVALTGPEEYQVQRISVPLDQEGPGGGCEGTASFGSMERLRARLGSPVRLVVFLLV
jgi:hypothetical protein